MALALDTGDLVEEARQLLTRLDSGNMSIAAYDTAWVARLPQVERADVPAFPESLAWLRTHQLPDGSWGGQNEYYCDRIISTLAAVLSLAQWRQDECDAERCERGLDYIWQKAPFLTHDPYETVGFELIVPTLLQEARSSGLRLPDAHFRDYERSRARKLQRIPPEMLYARENPAVYSLEFMGENLDHALAAGVQEDNGSVANSPSATVYFLRAWGEEPRARRYIAEVMRRNHGGAVFSFPLEIFEKAWVLYNLDLAGLLDQLREEARPHLDYLREVWDEHTGVAFSRSYSVCDLDDTAVVFKLLCKAAGLWHEPRYRVSPAVFEAYAEKDHFRTFRFESDPSLSANIHLLDALLSCTDEPGTRAMMETVISFMSRTRSLQLFWFDKWHASPYYVTAHAVLAAARDYPKLIEEAVYWLVNTQNEDGSWGHYQRPTVEETAYCLQALSFYRGEAGDVPCSTLDKAAAYLAAHRQERTHPPLWISKTLFAPFSIIESAIISALILYERARGSGLGA